MRYTTVRNRFLNYFKELNYAQLERASMLHPSIPMSFVMSAGLVQVESSLKLNKIKEGNKFVLIQDCFRHFDQKKVVSNSQNHLSLFEMSGAFEFGEINQLHTIKKIWNFIINDLKISKNQIWVTYFKGDRIGNNEISEDLATYHAWQSIGINEKRIVGLSKKDNFWIQGGSLENANIKSRKCGTNSEIFFDKGESYNCGGFCQPSCDCGRFIEFANILFIKYKFTDENQPLQKLATPFAETVIGNERVAMILQNKSVVFKIDSYSYLREDIAAFANTTSLDSSLAVQSINVIMDHLRAIYMLVADGAPPPGKGGRSHIMKKLIRGVVSRLIILDIPMESFIQFALEKIITRFGDKIDYNSSIKSKILFYFKTDSDRFIRTIEKGQRRILNFVKNNSEEKLSSSQIYYFEKTLGVPQVIIHKIAQENGITYY